MHIKKDDKVIVITGKDKGKSGTVVKALPRENKVVISGINLLKVHQRARRTGEKGQIVEKASPVHVSNVKLLGEKSESKKESKKETKPKAKAKTAAK